MATLDAYGNNRLVSLLPAASRSEDAAGSGVDTSEFEGIGAAHLSSAATDTGTADVYLQHAAIDVDGEYENILDGDGQPLKFAQVTDAAASEQVIPLDFNKTRQYVRARQVIGGGATVASHVGLTAPVAFAPVDYEG